MGSSTALRLPV